MGSNRVIPPHGHPPGVRCGLLRRWAARGRSAGAWLVAELERLAARISRRRRRKPPGSVFEGVARHGRRVGVVVLGTAVVLVGIVMVVAPGPAFVVIPLGLAILAGELPWARRLLVRFRLGLRWLRRRGRRRGPGAG